MRAIASLLEQAGQRPRFTLVRLACHHTRCRYSRGASVDERANPCSPSSAASPRTRRSRPGAHHFGAERADSALNCGAGRTRFRRRHRWPRWPQPQHDDRSTTATATAPSNAHGSHVGTTNPVVAPLVRPGSLLRSPPGHERAPKHRRVLYSFGAGHGGRDQRGPQRKRTGP